MENDDKVIIKVKKEYLSSEVEEIKQKKKRIIITLLLAIFLFLSGTGLGYAINKFIYPSYEIGADTTLGEIEFIMDKYWLYSYDYSDFIKELEDKAFYGMTYFNEDPYTTYMSYDESSAFTSMINMNYVGVGVQYQTINNVHTIKRVFKDSPAEIAGLQVGDIFLKVEDTPVDNLSSDDIKALVIGEPGTKVKFLVKRGNEEKEIVCVREAVDSSIYAYAVDDYVVLELLSFGGETANNCVKYLDEYTDYDKLIIDLRGNSGGYQSSVEEIAGLFIGNDEVYMRQQDKEGNEVLDYTDSPKTYENFKKIVLLVDGNTASAAEVLTICLREQFDDTKVVGTTTFGKGVVQSTFSLSNGASLKVTTTKWLSPNGVWINGVGIAPDEEVFLDDIMYENFYVMEEDETHSIDTVSPYTRVCQIALNYLGYDVNRKDGYFDEEFRQAIMAFQADNDLEVTGVLDVKTYNAIYYMISISSTDASLDKQKIKAVELLHE